MERKVVKTGLVQMACVADKQANIEKPMTLIREVAGKGAQIICMQELFASEYFCWEESYDNFSLAEPVPGPTTRRLQDLAAEFDVVLLASLFEKRARGIYHNTLAVIDADGTFLGKYRKNHIPDDPGYYEKEMNFWGGSFIADPYGELLFQASHEKEEVHVEEMDLGKIDEVRVHWPFLRDRRIDSYGPILNRYIEED